MGNKFLTRNKKKIPEWCCRERNLLGLSKHAKNSIHYHRAIYKATPIWFERNRIIKLYKNAQQFGLTVDHIVPLRHKYVCGLHKNHYRNNTI